MTKTDQITISPEELTRTYERMYGPFIHMVPSEKYIWARWLASGGRVHAPFVYDLRVGDGLTMPATSSRFEINQAYALTTKRIDALYYDGELCVIIEVKRRAGASAVGQLLTYRELILRGPNPPPAVAMLLVCESLQPDLALVLDQHNIQYNIV